MPPSPGINQIENTKNCQMLMYLKLFGIICHSDSSQGLIVLEATGIVPGWNLYCTLTVSNFLHS